MAHKHLFIKTEPGEVRRHIDGDYVSTGKLFSQRLAFSLIIFKAVDALLRVPNSTGSLTCFHCSIRQALKI